MNNTEVHIHRRTVYDNGGERKRGSERHREPYGSTTNGQWTARRPSGTHRLRFPLKTGIAAYKDGGLLKLKSPRSPTVFGVRKVGIRCHSIP